MFEFQTTHFHRKASNELTITNTLQYEVQSRDMIAVRHFATSPLEKCSDKLNGLNFIKLTGMKSKWKKVSIYNKRLK